MFSTEIEGPRVSGDIEKKAMLTELGIKNLTVFQEESIRFRPHLNVLIGENGTGKTHLLKLAYSILAVSAEEGRKPVPETPTKSLLQTRLADKLVKVFRPDALGRLVRRRQGRARCEVEAFFEDEGLHTAFSFATQSKSEVAVEALPSRWVENAPAFLPARELLTLYPNFVSICEGRYLEFEETYRDTCVLLGAPAVRGPGEERVRKLPSPLEEAMGGSVFLDKNGRFYMKVPGMGAMEMPLVAEGLRKLALVGRLIATGSLLDRGFLFWDEPDANLNPRLVRIVARTILDLCRNDVQVFLATHSLFLLREMDILLRTDGYGGLETGFCGLIKEEDAVSVQQGSSLDDIPAIVALDEELEQSDRFLEIDR